ncbi:MAG: sugar phosphate isomerase/epimerase [Clostridia bacterium]|nr:sugar phosphate isomerase/epimerase [Clostridia bacterium]
MKTLPVALQVYSIREEASKDFKKAMTAVKEIGYDGVELAGLYGIPAAEIKNILDEVGLVPVSAHVSELMNGGAELCDILNDYVTIGVKYIVVPYLGEGMRPGDENFDEILKKIENIGAEARKKGLTLLYHNHDFEFIKMPDGSYGLDYMYNNTAPENLQTELDTCWVNVGGENPSEYVKKYTGRAPVVHLKDFEGSKSEQMYELIGIKTEKKEEVKNTFRFRPVGHGKQDFPSILAAAVEAGAEWVVVEQDQWYDTPALECAKMSREYLKTLGW